MAAPTPSPYAAGLSPPPGVTSDFYDPFTLNPYYNVTGALSIMIVTVLVAARIYTKVVIIRAFNWEDFTCLVGWAAFMVHIGMNFAIGQHGKGGTHQWNVYEVDVEYHKWIANYDNMVYSIALAMTKLSILLLIKRIFCSMQRNIPYWITMFLIFVNTGFYIAFFFVPIFLCSPRVKIWQPWVPGTCLEVFKLYLASAIFNLVSDIMMLSVPIYLVWKLKVSTKRKIGISAIFLTGGLACLSSILRTVYVVDLIRTDDYTYVHMESNLWATAEVFFGLSCSCFVILPRLYQHIIGSDPLYKINQTSSNYSGNRTGKPAHNWTQLASRNHQTLDSAVADKV